MKRLVIAPALVYVLFGVSAMAQQPRPIEPAARHADDDLRLLSPGEVQATPEMWFYEQELRRYNDPKTALRAHAEAKAAQRRARLSAMAWYGYSNSRPQAGIDVVHGQYSPTWISNGYSPFSWVGSTNTSTVIVAPTPMRSY